MIPNSPKKKIKDKLDVIHLEVLNENGINCLLFLFDILDFLLSVMSVSYLLLVLS